MSAKGQNRKSSPRQRVESLERPAPGPDLTNDQFNPGPTYLDYLRQRDGVGRRHRRIDDGCAVEAIVGGGECGPDVIAEQDFSRQAAIGQLER
jgi:hypothetical protein